MNSEIETVKFVLPEAVERYLYRLGFKEKTDSYGDKVYEITYITEDGSEYYAMYYNPKCQVLDLKIDIREKCDCKILDLVLNKHRFILNYLIKEGLIKDESKQVSNDNL